MSLQIGKAGGFFRFTSHVDGKEELSLLRHLLGTRHCFSLFIFLISFQPHNHPAEQILLSHFTDKETDAQSDDVTVPLGNRIPSGRTEVRCQFCLTGMYRAGFGWVLETQKNPSFLLECCLCGRAVPPPRPGPENRCAGDQVRWKTVACLPGLLQES